MIASVFILFAELLLFANLRNDFSYKWGIDYSRFQIITKVGIYDFAVRFFLLRTGKFNVIRIVVPVGE